MPEKIKHEQGTVATGSELVFPILSWGNEESGLIVAGTASPVFVKIHPCLDKSKRGLAFTK